MWTFFYAILGLAFGFVLSRSGASDYNYIQSMFLLTDFQLYGIIGSAIVVTAPGLLLLKRYGTTLFGVAIQVTPKPRHTGNLVGGAIFGVGWSMTGMCPGPVLVNVGEGKLYALAALAGVLVGAGAFGVLYPRLVRPFGLPPLQVGTGDG